MDRPIRIDRLLLAGVGVLSIEGHDPDDMADRARELFLGVAASGQVSPYISGFTLGGGGGGASWRATFTTEASLGPGVQESIFAARARCSFARARGFAEINVVVARLLQTIEDAYATAFVYEVQVAGGGRDGEYLIGVLFGEEAESPPVLTGFVNTQAAVAVPTDVVSVIIPQTVSGTPNDQATYLVTWSIAVEDTDGASGFTAGLYSDVVGDYVEQYDDVGAAGDWLCQSGSYYVAQSVGADEELSIRIDPVANTISARDASITAVMVPRANEPS